MNTAQRAQLIQLVPTMRQFLNHQVSQHDHQGRRVLRRASDQKRKRYFFSGLTEEVVKESVANAHTDGAFGFSLKEDGESASKWYVYNGNQNLVSSVYDSERRSDVIHCGAGQSGISFIVGDRYNVNPNDDPWNDTRRVLSFWYRYGFDRIEVYVSVTGGYEYRVQYLDRVGDSGYNGSGWVNIYLGNQVYSSDWRRFERNVEEDWNTYAPQNLRWVNTDGVVIAPRSTYGWVTRIDDIRLSDSRSLEYNALTGGSIGQIAAQYTYGVFPAKTIRWLHYDRLGNVMNKSNESGVAVESFNQDAYGNLIANMNTGAWAGMTAGRHLTTKEYDGDAGLYYFYQRWYDPKVGRFVSKDPISPIKEHYVFSRNNPARYLDPSGLFPDPVVALCMRGIVEQVQNEYKTGESDKFVHCLVSCRAAQECCFPGNISCYSAIIEWGIIWELIGGWVPGDSMADIAANIHGVSIGICPGKGCEKGCASKFGTPVRRPVETTK